MALRELGPKRVGAARPSENSVKAKFAYRILHSPARWLPYGRPESSRFLKVDHYMLHLRIMMRSGAYVSSGQDTDYAGAGGGQEFRPRVCY